MADDLCCDWSICLIQALKESFIKAIGTGLGFDLQRVEFHISPNQMREGQVYRQTRMYLDKEEEDWTFEVCRIRLINLKSALVGF